MKLLLQIVILTLNIKTIFFQFELSEVMGTSSYLETKNPCNINETLCGNKPVDHILCAPLLGPKENCAGFKFIRLTDGFKLKIALGLNKLRNSEARRADFPVANMNQLYWDTDLGRMAEQTVYRCDINAKEDSCQFIGDRDHTIGSTIHFSSRYQGDNKWLEVALHSWYNYTITGMPDHFKKSTEYSAYTQLLWPSSRYVGCAAAKVFDGLLFACFYGPKGNVGPIEDAFIAGPPCTRCQIDRDCSLFFEGLCDELNGAVYIKNQPKVFWIIITIFNIAAASQGV